MYKERKELVDKINAIRSTFRKREKRFHSPYSDILEQANNIFKEVKETKLRGKGLFELEDILYRFEYLLNKKVTTIKGAKEVETIRNKFDIDTLREDFEGPSWSITRKILELNPSWEKIKYELNDLVIELLNDNRDENYIIDKLNRMSYSEISDYGSKYRESYNSHYFESVFI